MLLVAEKGREREVLDVFKKWGLDAVVVGEVTTAELLRVKTRGSGGGNSRAHPLAEEGPVYRRPLRTAAAAKKRRPDWFSFSAEGTDLALNFATAAGFARDCVKRWIPSSTTHPYAPTLSLDPARAMPRSSASRTGDGVVKRSLALADDAIATGAS